MGTAGAVSDQDLRYPVGRFQPPGQIAAGDVAAWIGEIETLPERLKKAVSGLKDLQLDTAYRPGGWNVRQVVHHLADSHMNSFMRFRLALTEDSPAIKTYNEAAWAELADSKVARVEVSVHLLEALHARWVTLLRSLKSADLTRTFKHPQAGEKDLNWALSLYAWHGRHHVAHITGLRHREGW